MKGIHEGVLRGNAPPRKHKQHGLWSQHEVDQGFWHRKRNATRGNAPTVPHWGAALEFDQLRLEEFLSGVGLYVQAEQPDFWKVVEPITRETLGYAPVHVAMGYKRAAAKRGVTLEVWQC